MDRIILLLAVFVPVVPGRILIPMMARERARLAGR